MIVPSLIVPCPFALIFKVIECNTYPYILPVASAGDWPRDTVGRDAPSSLRPSRHDVDGCSENRGCAGDAHSTGKFHTVQGGAARARRA